jgi:5,10-methylenetetrahydrofolate reductase/5'-3' exonuclease
MLLLDSASLYFRAFFGVPEVIGPSGVPTNAVRGLLDMIASLVDRGRPTHLVACWDNDWRPAFRVEAIPSYKAHRVAEPGPDDLAGEQVPEALGVQVPIIIDALTALGIARVGVDGYEADDVIGTLATRFSGRMPVDIVTGDRDLFQLVDDLNQVRVIYTARGGVRSPDLVDQAFLAEKYGVGTGAAYADMAVLRGDTSDGLPGVAGIGEKTAAKLITTYGTLEAIRAAIDEGRTASSPVQHRVLAEPALPASAEAPTELARMFQAGEFVVSVQLDPPLGGNVSALVDAARELKQSGLAQIVDVNDNPRARARMSGLIASMAIEQRAGIETVPHLTPRDATIAGLESMLLGAHASGIRNVLAVTGDPPEAGDYPGTGAVYDVDAIGLVELLSRFNAGEDFHRRAIDAPTAFFPGVAVNPSADDLDLELERFELKLAAGAKFAMTQILFDLSYLERFLERLGGSFPIPLLVGVWPIRSYELAVRVHNETPGIVVPAGVQKRYQDAGAGAQNVGIEIGRELIAGARDLAAGVYVVAPFRQPLGVLDVLG